MIARTLDEIERHAHANGDAAIVALIHRSEEEIAETVTPEHEAVIDDRNRLRDALTECMERMHDAIEQLDTFNTTEATPDLITGELPVLNFAPAFHDAAEAAGKALGECEPQVDATARQKYAKSAARIAGLERTTAELRHKLDTADRLLRAVYFVLKPWNPQPSNRSAPPPKWAQHLLDAVKRTGARHA